MLKFSVSTLVLISLISSLTPSHAGNGNGRDKDPEGKTSSTRVPKKKNAFDFQRTAQESGAGSLTKFCTDPTLDMLIFSGQGLEAAQKLPCVCRNWNEQINQHKKRLIKQLNERSTTEQEDIDADSLRQFLSHPETFMSLHNWIARLRSAPIIQMYGPLIDKNKKYQPFFSKMCTSFYPLTDSDSIELAGIIINNSDNCQKFISEVADKSKSTIENFLELTQNPENFKRLQGHLMALNYMATTNHKMAEDVRGKQKKFLGVLNDYFTGKSAQVRKDPNVFFRKNLNFMAQPFWSVYTGNKDIVKDELGLVLSIADSPLSTRLDYEKVQNFWDYTCARHPSLSYSPMNYGTIMNLLYLPSPQSKELYKKKNYINFPQVIKEVITPYMDTGKHRNAILILKHTLEEVENAPFRYQLLFKMAECILISQEDKHFSDASTCIEDLLKEFEERNTDELDTTFEYLLSIPYETGPHEAGLSVLPKGQVNILKVGLALSQEEVEVSSVKKALKNSHPDSIFDGQNELILKILKTKFSSIEKMPKALKKVLSDEANSDFSKKFFQTPQGQKMIEKYGDVLLDFLGKSKFKQLQKDNVKAKKY